MKKVLICIVAILAVIGIVCGCIYWYSGVTNILTDNKNNDIIVSGDDIKESPIVDETIEKQPEFTDIEFEDDEKITYIMKEGMQEEVNYEGVKSSLGYAIQYAKEDFSLERENNKDFYRLNVSEDMKDKVYFSVEFLEKSFEELKNENIQNDIEELEINGQKAFIVSYIDGILANDIEGYSAESKVENYIYIDAIKGTYLVYENYLMKVEEGFGTDMYYMINSIKSLNS